MNTRKFALPWTLASAAATAMFFGCGDGDNGININDVTVLSKTADLALGDAMCPSGGVKITAGIDKNKDGQLSEDEITSTAYACNGANGSLMIQRSDEPAGQNCAGGGIKVETGYDVDGDGALTGAEVKHIGYICGSEHPLTVSTDEPAGANCEFGGIRLDMGDDANGDGALSAGEISSTAYTCFTEAQANALNAAAFLGSMDNLLIRLYGAASVWGAKLSEDVPRRDQAPNSYSEHVISQFCALTDDWMDASMNMSALHSSALSTTSNIAQEIREGRLVFDAAAFNSDFAVLNDSFKLCSGATFEKILTKFEEIGLDPEMLFFSGPQGSYAPPNIIFEKLSGMLAKNYLHGNVADGGACYFNSECANANAACISLKDSGRSEIIVPSQQECSIGACIPLKAAGEACKYSDECYDQWCYNPNQSENGVCTHLTTTTTLGDTCGYVSPGQFVGCGDTVDDYYRCAYDNSSDQTGTCVYDGDDLDDETVGLGEDCTDYGCKAGLYCKETYEDGSDDPVSSICTAQLANGAKCVYGAECLSDFCYHKAGENEGVCWGMEHGVELGGDCGLVKDFSAAYCGDMSVCLYPSGNIDTGDFWLRRQIAYPEMPTEKGKCIFSGNVGLAVGESCTSNEECLDSWSGMTACMGPDRTALIPDESGLVAGTCQYVGDVGDKCSNANAPKVNVCKRPLECNNTTGLCQELPSAGSAPSVNYPYCNPINSAVVRDLRSSEMPPPVCEPLLDAGEAVNPESMMYDSAQCKSHYALNGICLDDVSFYVMVEEFSSYIPDYMSSACALESLFSSNGSNGVRPPMPLDDY